MAAMAAVRGRVIPVLLVLCLLAFAGGCGRSAARRPAPAPAAVVGGGLLRLPDLALPEDVQVPPVAAPAPDGLIATAAIPKIGLYDEPRSAAPASTMGNPNALGVPLVFLVRQESGDWLQVQVPERPNERTAWVHRSDVTLTTTTFHLRVELSTHRLVAFDGSSQVFETPVAIGAASAPTPTGTYYIDGSFKLANPKGPYGAYALSVAAFSDVFKSFSGGPGQIALHGTNQPALIGTPASHGCVRMTNDAITHLVQLVPVGTPVDIVA